MTRTAWRTCSAPASRRRTRAPAGYRVGPVPESARSRSGFPRPDSSVLEDLSRVEGQGIGSGSGSELRSEATTWHSGFQARSIRFWSDARNGEVHLDLYLIDERVVVAGAEDVLGGKCDAESGIIEIGSRPGDTPQIGRPAVDEVRIRVGPGVRLGAIVR